MSLNEPTVRSIEGRERKDLEGIDQFDPRNLRTLARARRETTLQVFNVLHQTFPGLVYEEVANPYLEAVCHWTGGEIDPNILTDEVDHAEPIHTPDMEGLIDARRRLLQLVLEQIPIELMPQDIEPEDIEPQDTDPIDYYQDYETLADQGEELGENQSSDFQDSDEDIHPDQADQFLHLQQIEKNPLKRKKRRAKQPRGFPETPAACKKGRSFRAKAEFQNESIDSLGQVE